MESHRWEPSLSPSASAPCSSPVVEKMNRMVGPMAPCLAPPLCPRGLQIANSKWYQVIKVNALESDKKADLHLKHFPGGPHASDGAHLQSSGL